MTITYSFSGNGNSTYAIGSLVDWHSSALIADQIQVLLNDVELVDGVDYEISEGAKALVLTSPASGSDTITLNRVTPDAFFSTLETVGAASATSTLSNDQQLMNRIQEVEADIVVASANTTIQDDNGNLFGILKPGDNVGFTFNPSDGSLTVSSSGGGSGGGGSGISLDFTDGIGSQGPATSFIIDSATTGFATTVVSDDLQAQISQLNSDLGGYVQTSGFNTLFDGRFDTRIADYEVKNISSPNGTLTITENGAGNFELETAGGQSVSSLQGQAGDLLMDMRVDGADTGVSNRIGLDGCSHDPTTPTFAGVTPAGTATGVEGWSWIHDVGAGSFVSHKPLSGTRDSELIEDKILTLGGTLRGDSTFNIKVNDDTHIRQKQAATDLYHLRPQWQEKAEQGYFKIGSGFYEPSTDAHSPDVAYLMPIDNGSYTTYPNYVYPDLFEKRTSGSTTTTAFRKQNVDYTSFNPGGGRYTDGVDTRPVFYPGFDHSLNKIASPVPGRVANGDVGDTARHWQTSGINEPGRDSGRIREDAPVRLFNISAASRGWTSGDRNYNNIGGNRHSYMSPFTGSPHSVNKYALYLNSGNSDNSNQITKFVDKMNILYVPANVNGGLVTLSATFSHGVTRPRGYIVLFAGMDEANKNVGPKESIIPVAGHQSSVTYTTNYTPTTTYTFDMSDGLPRYFGFMAMHESDGNSDHRGIEDWSLTRADGPSVGTYHDSNIDENTSTTWTFERGTYDRYVQDVLETYSVDQ